MQEKKYYFIIFIVFILSFVWQKSIFCNKTPQNKPKGCLSNTPLKKKKTFSKNIAS
jgi:hypothetical protein